MWDVNTSKSVTANTTEILKKIVANEVGGFTSAQLSAGDRRSLYQAQAVAAHSWLIYQIRHGVSTPSVGLASSYSSEISSAVESVKDVLVKYNGDVANTAYGSCAAEKTNSAANMGWGNYCLPGQCGQRVRAEVCPLPVLPQGYHHQAGDNAQQCHQNGGRNSVQGL